jgi:hypothetical protein
MIDSPAFTSRARLGKTLALAAAILAFLLAGTSWIAFVRHTSLGISIGGGSTYWVSRAAETQSDLEAKDCLRKVLDSSQYGVNMAQRDILRLEDTGSRARLFGLLVQLAPNEHWRRIYGEDRHRASQY